MRRYGSLAATGKGYVYKISHHVFVSNLGSSSHHTPQAILLGLEGTPSTSLQIRNINSGSRHIGSDPEDIETATIPSRYAFIQEQQVLHLAGRHRIEYIMERDMLWRWDQVLPTHPNGMRFTCFAENGDLLATNEYYRYVYWSYLGLQVSGIHI